MLGGRNGKRIRKLFTNKRDAEDYEHVLKADFKRGTFIPEKKTITFEKLADKYFNEHCLAQCRKPNHFTIYMVNKLKKYFGNRLAESITKQDVREYRDLLKTKLKASSVNRIIAGVLNPIFNKGLEWELLDKNPCQYLEQLQTEEPAPRFLTIEEIALLFKTPTAQRMKVKDYMSILLHTGARPVSIKECSFDKGDVSLESKTIWFTTYKGRKIKRYPHPMDDTLFEIVSRRFKETGGKGLVFDTSGIDDACIQVVDESGINKDRTHKFTIYGLKHSYASHLLMSGASLYDVSKLLGHTSTKMLEKHYGHLTQDHLRRVQSKINLTPNE